MNIFYLSASDPNSHGNILKFYYEKMGYGKYNQISRKRPTKKAVDITYEFYKKPIIHLSNGKTIVGNKSMEYIGKLADRADIIHVDRPTMNNLFPKNNKQSNLYLHIIKNGKKILWGDYLKTKPCVFNYRGSTLMMNFDTPNISKLWETYKHAVPIFCNPHLSYCLPKTAQMLPFCGNEEVWKNFQSNPSTFSISLSATHTQKQHSNYPKWLNTQFDKLPSLVNKKDFAYGVDGNTNLALSQLPSWIRQNNFNIKINNIVNNTYHQSLQKIAQSSCHFDNFIGFGSYGWGAVEAMYFKKPVLNGISYPFQKNMGENPFLQTENMKTLKANIKKIYNSKLEYEKYKVKSMSFYEKYHKPENVINNYLIPIYEKALDNFIG